MRVAFDVEQAGCASCGRLITTALSSVGAVESVEIDEGDDLARVVLSAPSSRGDVDDALKEASATAGHVYRVRAGSWQPLD